MTNTCIPSLKEQIKYSLRTKKLDIGALACVKRAQRNTMGKKCGKLAIQKNTTVHRLTDQPVRNAQRCCWLQQSQILAVRGSAMKPFESDKQRFSSGGKDTQKRCQRCQIAANVYKNSKNYGICLIR